MAVFVYAGGAGALPETADVVIVGGGLAGASALWALGKLAPELRVVLLERRGQLASGSSIASLENFRACWMTPCIASQMRYSLDVFHHADAHIGAGAHAAIHPKQRGYLFCAFTEAQAATFRAEVAHMHGLGLTQLAYLDAAAVGAHFGWVGERVLAAKYDPQAGWLDSNALVNAYAKSAPNAHVVLNAGEVALHVEGGRVRGVRTPYGAVAAGAVLLAAGAWSGEVARTAGLELPIVIRPRQSVTTAWRHADFPADAPMLINAYDGTHIRPEAQNGAIMGWEYRWHSKHAPAELGTNAARDALLRPLDPPDRFKDPRFGHLTLHRLARAFGHRDGEGFADGRYLRGAWHNVGYYVYRSAAAAYRTLPDGTRQPYDSERALIDAHPDVRGLYLSLAHGGHGIMTSPAAGQIAAHHVLGRALPDPLWADFGYHVAWVAHDEAVL